MFRLFSGLPQGGFNKEEYKKWQSSYMFRPLSVIFKAVIKKENYGRSYYISVSNYGPVEVYALTYTARNMDNVRLYVELISTERDQLVAQSDNTTHNTFLCASIPISTSRFLPIATKTFL